MSILQTQIKALISVSSTRTVQITGTVLPARRNPFSAPDLNMSDFTDDYINGLRRFDDVINGYDMVVNHRQPEHSIVARFPFHLRVY